MKDSFSFSQFYPLRCLAVGGYLCSTILLYLTSGAAAVALFVFFLHRLFPLLGGLAGVLFAIVGIQVLTIASAISCEALGQTLLRHANEDRKNR
jgi:hypothetical protein